MTETEKRSAINEFFCAPRPFYSIAAITIGICIASFGLLAMAKQSYGFGFFLMITGVVWSILLPISPKARGSEPENEAQNFSIIRYAAAKERYEARPTVKEMYSWLREDIAKVQTESKPFLGLEETTREPICVYGPLYYDNVDGFDTSVVLRRRVNGAYFYSTYRVSVFQFTESFLGAYQGNLNMIKDAATAERTDEYFYRDVVAVRTLTESSNYVLKGGEKLEHSKMFSLVVSSGDRISVVINDPKIKATSEIESAGDEAVNNIRAMLRQYKVSAQAS